jgi:hypothetical protein
MNSRDIALGERDAVVSFLRSKARSCRKHASRLLADTMQNKKDADRWEDKAKTCEECAEQISQEVHWK